MSLILLRFHFSLLPFLSHVVRQHHHNHNENGRVVGKEDLLIQELKLGRLIAANVESRIFKTGKDEKPAE
ncbi:hypothetical protein ECG_07333 [Echinococcus granulosus]|uniref:Secreted protein n=1 Tax=Echinococcus granulosus TaxID=6210 RepID=A0A068WWJ4_ECHGR|nr:hypothetical protein ECG_07333 [Echinococcus granulosus]CDS22016.1 hypothetical protein EgrG_000066100 [Echinococcus granulosus]